MICCLFSCLKKPNTFSFVTLRNQSPDWMNNFLFVNRISFLFFLFFIPHPLSSPKNEIIILHQTRNQGHLPFIQHFFPLLCLIFPPFNFLSAAFSQRLILLFHETVMVRVMNRFIFILIFNSLSHASMQLSWTSEIHPCIICVEAQALHIRRLSGLENP